MPATPNAEHGRARSARRGNEGYRGSLRRSVPVLRESAVRHRILVIDSELESRTSLRAALADHNVTVVLSASAKDGIARLKRRQYAIVLCADTLPDLEGLTLLQVEKRCPSIAGLFR